MDRHSLRKQALQAHEESEQRAVRGAAARAQASGRSISVADFYPEYRPPASLGYTRHGVPLLLMSLFYEQLVVYVPPTSRAKLKSRWGVGLDEVGLLAEHGIIQPLMGHIGDYNSEHFTDLLATPVSVPSVWTRGLTLLTEVGLEDTLKPESYPFDFDQLASEPEIVARFKRNLTTQNEDRFHQRIRSELLTNLADLYLFGEEDLVEGLCRSWQRVPPAEIARAIMLLSEVRAYPTLFGMGGTANYAASEIDALPSLGDDLTWATSTPRGHSIGAEALSDLLKGIGIDASQLTAQGVLDFHASADAKRLRRAMTSFEAAAHKLAVADRDTHSAQAEVLDEAIGLRKVVASAISEARDPRLRRKYDRTRSASRWVFEVGGLAVGGWVGHETLGNAAYGAIGGAAVLRTAVLDPLKDYVSHALASRRFSPGVANLWRIRGSK